MSEGSSRRSPYPGLDSFAERDEAFFFGRRRDAQLIAANVFASRLTVLYGPSGVGKTSVLHAGVLPRLRARPDVLPVLVGRWSGDPGRSVVRALAAAAPEAGAEDAALVDALSACAADLGRRPILLLDQFEDSFAGSDAFVEELAAALTAPGLPLAVLISIREESLAGLDRYDGLVPGLFDTVLRLEHLDRQAAEEVVYEPLRVWNETAGEQVTIDPPLVEAILDEVPRGATGIDTALLQLALARVWDAERASGATVLRAGALDRLGGVDGIVRDHVRGALDGLAPREQALAGVVLDRLVTPSGTRIAHRTGDLAQYAGAPEDELRPMLRRLGEERVLRPVAAEDRAERYEVFHASLADAVLEWLNARRDAEERERLRRRARRFGILALVGSIVIGTLLGLALYAASQRTKRQAARSHAFGAAAVGLLDSDPALGLSLAQQAVREQPTRPAESALRAALAASRERAVLNARAGGVSEVSAGGGDILTAHADGGLRVWRGGRARVLARRPGLEGAVLCPDARRVAVGLERGARLVTPRRPDVKLAAEGGPVAARCSADGRRVAAIGTQGARVYDAATGRRIATIRWRAAVLVADGALDATGSRLILGGLAGTTVWRVAGGKLLARIGGREQATRVALSGGRAAVADAGLIALWSASTGRRLLALRGDVGFALAVAFSPDGALVAAAGQDRTARLWDAATGEPVAVLRGHEGPVTSVAFAPASLVTGSDDGTARVWALPPPRLARGPAAATTAAQFSADGSKVAAAGGDGVVVWDVASGRRLTAFRAGPADHLAVSPDGTQVVTFDSPRGRARLWTPAGSRRLAGSAVSAAFGRRGPPALGRDHGVLELRGREVRVGGDEPVAAVAYSPDGRRVAAGTFPGGAISIFDAATGAPVVRMRTPHAGLQDLAFSAGGRSLVSAGGDQARIWDVASGRPRVVVRAPAGLFRSARLSADGRILVTTGTDGMARLWDASAGAPLAALPARAATVTADGRGLAVVGATTTPRRLPCDACGSPDQLEARARGRITRPLTPALRAQYGG